jgi:hypothetical protein
MLAELKELFSGLGSYVTVEQIEQQFTDNPETPAPEVLERAFRDHFVDAADKFNKTLLHYLLTRLGKVKSSVAIPYAVGLLSHRPDETDHALRYLNDVDIAEAECDPIVDYRASDEAIYDYQLYQCISWFRQRHVYPVNLVRLCRRWAFDHNRDPWLRMTALASLGEVGDQADLEAIEGHYERVTNEMERAAIISALARMETGRRNAFYGRAYSDGDMVARAVNWAKSH